VHKGDGTIEKKRPKEGWTLKSPEKDPYQTRKPLEGFQKFSREERIFLDRDKKLGKKIRKEAAAGLKKRRNPRFSNNVFYLLG